MQTREALQLKEAMSRKLVQMRHRRLKSIADISPVTYARAAGPRRSLLPVACPARLNRAPSARSCELRQFVGSATWQPSRGRSQAPGFRARSQHVSAFIAILTACVRPWPRSNGGSPPPRGASATTLSNGAPFHSIQQINPSFRGIKQVASLEEDLFTPNEQQFRRSTCYGRPG